MSAAIPKASSAGSASSALAIAERLLQIGAELLASNGGDKPRAGRALQVALVFASLLSLGAMAFSGSKKTVELTKESPPLDDSMPLVLAPRPVRNDRCP